MFNEVQTYLVVMVTASDVSLHITKISTKDPLLAPGRSLINRKNVNVFNKQVAHSLFYLHVMGT